jgi:hypothetical protein
MVSAEQSNATLHQHHVQLIPSGQLEKLIDLSTNTLPIQGRTSRFNAARHQPFFKAPS